MPYFINIVKWTLDSLIWGQRIKLSNHITEKINTLVRNECAF